MCLFSRLSLNIVHEVLASAISKETNKSYVEKAMAPHSSTLAWKLPWTEEPGGLLSMRLLRVGHD